MANFLTWVKEQVEQGYQVISCYEAGPTGYWLHRKLEGLGVTNYVVCPTRLDSRGKGVNTDKSDAVELLVRLDRYVAGNRKAFSVVTVPTPEQEQKRALSRQREQLRRQRLSVAAQGRMLLLGQGYRESNFWWQGARWERLQERLPEWLVSQLECFKRVIATLDQEVRALTTQVSQAAPARLPRGMGQLTHEIIEREMRDWNNFKNRRQVGSYAGLTRRGQRQWGKQCRPEHHQGGQPALKRLFNRVLLAPGVAPAGLLAGPEMEARAAQSQSRPAPAQAGHCGLCPPTAH